MKSFTLLFITTLLIGVTLTQDPSVVKLPITPADGYGPFPVGFAMLGWRVLDSANPWHKTELNVTGIPKEWTSVVKKNIWFDGKQFAYQNYKQGNLSTEVFNDLKTSWNIDFGKRSFSENPIKCYVYIVYGKDKDGKIKYKLDTNNNLDFSDEAEQTPAKLAHEKSDSLARVSSISVRYQAFRNGKVVELTAPILVLENNGSLLRNFPLHSQAVFGNDTIRISSQGFMSLDYDPASLAYVSENSSEPEIIGENEFIKLGSTIYKNLGVNVEQQVLFLKKMPNDTLIFSTQVGFQARPFSGKEFTTQKEISLDRFKGKYLYLEFWGSWCRPCISEIPNLKKAYERTDRARLEFLGIAQDRAEPLKKLLEKEQIPWQQILCEKEDGIIDEYNIQGYPTSFLIDPKGKIIAKNLRGDHLLDSLNSYLQRN